MLIRHNSLLEAKKYRTPVDSLLAMVQPVLPVVSSAHAMSPCTQGREHSICWVARKMPEQQYCPWTGAGQCTLERLSRAGPCQPQASPSVHIPQRAGKQAGRQVVWAAWHCSFSLQKAGNLIPPGKLFQASWPQIGQFFGWESRRPSEVLLDFASECSAFLCS